MLKQDAAHKPIRFIQLTDAHLSLDSHTELLQVNTEDSFKAVVALLNKHSDIDLLLLTGDLSQDGSEAAYERIAQILKKFTMPIYCLPGNHDDATVMRRVYAAGPILMKQQILLQNWQIILLNSQKIGAVEGLLAADELNLLNSALAAYPARHTIVVFHHPPVAVGSAWLDGSQLTNADQFWQIIARYKNVRGIVCGHVHQAFEKLVNGIPVYTTPSTCIQFKPNQTGFTLDNIPPGLRSFALFEDGHIETSIQRVSHYVGVFDDHSKGY